MPRKHWSTLSLLSILGITILAFFIHNLPDNLLASKSIAVHNLLHNRHINIILRPFSSHSLGSAKNPLYNIKAIQNPLLNNSFSMSSEARVSRKLAKAPILAVEQNEGVGATVRRSIGGPGLKNWTPFLSKQIGYCFGSLNDFC